MCARNSVSAARGNRVRRLFIDLDGPILDVASRYYAVHCEIAGIPPTPDFSLGSFWHYKRRAASFEEIISAAGTRATIDPVAYRAAWLDRIEATDYLSLDTVQPGAIAALDALFAAYPLTLVTLRQSAACVSEQLRSLDLLRYFETVLCAAPCGAESWRKKRDLILQDDPEIENAAIVGDTEVDIRAGRALGMTTIAVRSGIRSDELLISEEPDYIVDSLADVPRALQEQLGLQAPLGIQF